MALDYDSTSHFLTFHNGGSPLLVVRLWVALTLLMACVGGLHFVYFYGWVKGFAVGERQRIMGLPAQSPENKGDPAPGQKILRISRRHLVMAKEMNYGIDMWKTSAQNTDHDASLWRDN